MSQNIFELPTTGAFTFEGILISQVLPRLAPLEGFSAASKGGASGRMRHSWELELRHPPSTYQ